MDDRTVTKKPGRRSADRTRDSERTKADILTVATKEFANHGLTGARIDTIAALMRTSKRMIYYYFGSKEGLYLAVLEKAYTHVRATEASLPLRLPRCRGRLATACRADLRKRRRKRRLRASRCDREHSLRSALRKNRFTSEDQLGRSEDDQINTQSRTGRRNVQRRPRSGRCSFGDQRALFLSSLQ